MLKNGLKPRKMRSDAVWHRLTPEQAALLDNWLLDERPRPRLVDILARIASQFGFKSSLTALSAYNRRREEVRLQRDLLLVQVGLQDGTGQPLSTGQLRHAVLNRAGQSAINLVAEQAGNLSPLLAVAHVLLNHEELELQRRRLDHALSRSEKNNDLQGATPRAFIKTFASLLQQGAVNPPENCSKKS